MDEAERLLDGNAVGGLLGEVFAVEMTTAASTCAGCGSRTPLGGLRAYTDAPGTVLRCPHCDLVVLRIARTPDAYWLDLRGSATLRVPAP